MWKRYNGPNFIVSKQECKQQCKWYIPSTDYATTLQKYLARRSLHIECYLYILNRVKTSIFRIVADDIELKANAKRK